MKPNEIKVSTDFTNFPAKTYLEEYFSSNGQENQALLTFLHQTYKNLPRQGSLIEMGGGQQYINLLVQAKKLILLYSPNLPKVAGRK